MPESQKVGIRAVEIGGVMSGKPDPQNPGREILPDLDLVRLAVRRRVYANTHLEHVTDVTARIRREPGSLRGVRIVRHSSRPAAFHGAFRAALSEPAGPSELQFRAP